MLSHVTLHQRKDMKVGQSHKAETTHDIQAITGDVALEKKQYYQRKDMKIGQSHRSETTQDIQAAITGNVAAQKKKLQLSSPIIPPALTVACVWCRSSTLVLWYWLIKLGHCSSLDMSCCRNN